MVGHHFIFSLLLSFYVIINDTHIWNCGNLCAGSNNTRSNSLAAASCNCNQCGWPWACRPLLAFIAQEESKTEITFICELLKQKIYQ